MNNDHVTPTRIANTKEQLIILWQDSHRSVWDIVRLRKNCPCAECRGGDFGEIGTMTGHITEAGIVEIGQSGRYGLVITWTDQHDSGIYTFQRLRQICECDDCQNNKA
ncbi:MAG TPA: DUF971 domain-containing protein [Spirochaetes bacterium]|nr:DUF971 domain-containing protein [Spirochaetota bacterium]